ncbi:MAG: hypothetical protein JXR83_18125 [Deltaproteobacteria bacterium]|nr:hypothetical protein [Deltaproteobacteria bacterium]
MNETAAILVDHVLPRAPMRQWVITFPIELRYRLAYDEILCSSVLGIFLRAVSSWYRRKASRLGYAGGRTGSVTVIQRASSDLRINPHFHALVLDFVLKGLSGSPSSVGSESRPTSPNQHRLRQRARRRTTGVSRDTTAHR